MSSPAIGAEAPRPNVGVVTPVRAGWAGLVLVLAALWIVLPPIEVRTATPSLLMCALAAGGGLWVIRRGKPRLGVSVIATALLVAVVASLAANADTAKLEVVFVWSTLTASMLANATPLLFAGLGGVIAERSGVINIGLEGIMLTGAFFGLLGADLTGSWILGLTIAGAAGAFLALVYGIFAIQLRADQIVAGVAVNLLALGITGYLLVNRYGQQGTPSDLAGIPDVHLGFLDHVYFLGPAFGDLNLMVWVGLVLVGVVHLLLFHTPVGLRLRAVGEKPEAADTGGVPVYRVRYLAVLASGVFAALGGAYLSLGFVHAFTENMTAGRGYIALAAVVFGAWRPFGVLGAVLLFGFASALALRLPEFSDSAASLFQALPYVLTLVVVAGLIGRSRAPAADGVPYLRR